MRTHLLHLLTVVAAISVLLFASVAYAQNEDPTLEEDFVRLCDEANGRIVDGSCSLPLGTAWCGTPGVSPAIACDEPFADQFAERVYWETGQTRPEPEPAPVEQAPTAELPATQPAPAQQRSPQYTG